MIARALLLLAMAATVLGLANLHSASTGTDGVVASSFAAQATHACLALVVFSIASRISPVRLRDHARLFWMGGVFLLGVVHLDGAIGGGAQSWLALGPVRLQPSELLKVLLPLVIAAELSRPRVGPAWRRWALVSTLIGVPLAFIALQPDMGAVGLLGLSAITLIWIAGVPRWVVPAGAIAAALTAPVGWMALQGYQRERILTFIQPGRDPSGSGYQTLQSLYTVVSGGWLGRGWGSGTQGRLGFLPEHATDFILASIAEEWGILGVALTLGVLFGLVMLGLTVAERSRDRFSALFAAGLSLQLLWQIVVNAGGILGILPLTGVTLPFFSYGGSSLLVVWIAVAWLVSIARHTERRRVPLTGQASTEVPLDATRPFSPTAAARRPGLQ